MSTRAVFATPRAKQSRWPGMTASLASCLALSLSLLVGCAGDPMGADCEFRGSGFHASTNCRYRCLETRAIECPDGALIRPAVCSGKTDCSPGDCAEGTVCYTMQDAFSEESFCIPRDLCGDYPENALAAWEKEKQVAAAALRAEYEERRRLRERNAQQTAPATSLPAQTNSDGERSSPGS